MNAEELAGEMNTTVWQDAKNSTQYTRGRFAVVARLLEAEIKKRD